MTPLEKQLLDALEKAHAYVYRAYEYSYPGAHEDELILAEVEAAIARAREVR